jgi:hypothetical protein
MTTEQFAELLAILNNHTWALAITAIATALTAIAAVSALLLATKQILAAHSGIKATFIAELDGRWEGSEMKNVRAKWIEMREHIRTLVEGTYGNLTAQGKDEKMGDECSKYLHDLRIQKPNAYNDIISVVGFFETAGYSIHKKYIPADDVMDLFGEAIRELDRLCWKHMQKRIEESKAEGAGMTTLFEHACKLVVSTRTWYESRSRYGP